MSEPVYLSLVIRAFNFLVSFLAVTSIYPPDCLQGGRTAEVSMVCLAQPHSDHLCSSSGHQRGMQTLSLYIYDGNISSVSALAYCSAHMLK